MDPVDALERCYAVARPLVAAVGEGDLAKPTPCPDWDVRTLLSHLVTVTETFPIMLADGEPDWSRDALADRDPLDAFDEAVATNLEAWRVPGAVEKDSSLMPGMKVFDFNLMDAVVHTWDLATALGVEVELPGDAVELLLERWEGSPADTGRQYGAFGPEVAVGESDAPLDRLLGMVGRGG